jgi:O-antigen ligase
MTAETSGLKKYLLENRRESLWVVLLIALFTGAMLSKFIISISIMLMVVQIALRIQFKDGRVSGMCFTSISTQAIKRFIKNPAFSLFLLIIPATILSAIYSENTQYGFSRLQLYLPYLALPVVFWNHKSMSEYGFRVFILICMIINTMILVGMIANYAMQFGALTEAIGQGRSLPSPTSHIRLSLFTGFLSISGYWLIIYQKINKGTFLYRALLILATCLLIGLHVLAVRSGLALFYLGALYLLVGSFFTNKNYLKTTALILALAALPVISYYALPSFKMRLDYMKYDLTEFLSGNAGSNSDSDRIRSMATGLQIFKEHKLMGVGIGDVREAMLTAHINNYDTPTRVNIPHNQFIYFLAATGVVGAILIFPALLFPYLRSKGAYSGLISLHGIFFLASCLVEPTMEGTVGIVFHLLFLLLLLNKEKDRQ